MTRTQIRINIKYLSLNARDLQIVTGDYPAPHDIPQDCVPVSGMSELYIRVMAIKGHHCEGC